MKASASTGKIRRSGRAGIAMVPEGRRVFPYMTVKDNLLMGAFTVRTKPKSPGRSKWF
jgi:ABC-type branched-subunit amino acid transport system ATPase component